MASLQRPPPPSTRLRSRYYDALGCKGAVVQTVANFLGCLVAADQTVSYKAACLNASAFAANYYRGASCAGAVIHAEPVAWNPECSGAAGGSTFTSAS